MKIRRFSALLAALMILSTVPALAMDGSTTNGLATGTIVGGPVAVYDGMWADANVVGTLANGTAVVITQTYSGWIQVFARAERIVGWVPAGNVQYTQATPVYSGIVISQNVSLRSDRSTGATRLASIPNGTYLDILTEQDGWYYVNYYDQKNASPLQGWVLSDYIVRDPSFVTTTKATYVYAVPSRSAKKVGQLISGTQLVVIGEYDDFWVVNLRSASGFIYKPDIEGTQISGGNG